MTDAALLESLYEHVLSGDAAAAARLADAGLEHGVGSEALLYGAVLPSLREAAARLERGDAFVPEVLGVAHAAESALDVLRPALETSAIRGDVGDVGTSIAVALLGGGRCDEIFTSRFTFRA